MEVDIELIKQKIENRRKIKEIAALRINRVKLKIIKTLK